MSRELDGLLDKLVKINREMGGDEGQGKAARNGKGDHFHELKAQVGERLHRLKTVLQESEAASRKPKHPREAIRRQQEIREDIRLAGLDIAELTTGFEQEAKKKKSKFSPEEMQMRKEIVMQYSVEFERIKELASANYRSPAGRSAFESAGVTSSVGSFENGTFTMRTKPSGMLGSSGRTGGIGGFTGGAGAGEGGGEGGGEREEITAEQRTMLARIHKNDQRFDKIIEQIGTGVQELGQQARMLSDEIQQQAIMIDGLETRIDRTQEHVENVNRKMRETLAKVGRGADKCMMDMICLILLLGVLAVVYNMFIKQDPSSTTTA